MEAHKIGVKKEQRSVPIGTTIGSTESRTRRRERAERFSLPPRTCGTFVEIEMSFRQRRKKQEIRFSVCPSITSVFETFSLGRHQRPF